jgi:3-methyladenine DNA glycosylase Tag
MMEDQYLLKNRDKIFAKFANDAAAQAIENHLKEKGQINVTGEPVKRTVKKDDPNKVAEHFFSN